MPSSLVAPDRSGAAATRMPALRLIESDAFSFEWVSELAEAESWRKEVYRPVYHLHKWWAKRLGSVFRAILLGSVLPEDEDLQSAFYRRHDLGGMTVFDPFMGSGTTIGEAHKLGCVALGRDINPVACQSVKVSLGPLDRDALMRAFAGLSAGVGERVRGLYRTRDAGGQICDALYYFWVKTVPCLNCGASVDLFSCRIFARNAYPDRKPEVRICCRTCGGIFAASIKDQAVACPHCGDAFDPHRGPAGGASATCDGCRRSFVIARAVQATGHPPVHRLFAKLVLTDAGDKVYLPAGEDDAAAYHRCSVALRREHLPLPSLELADGHNTRQALNYGYRTWRQFFNDRQLLALGLLHQAILGLPDAVVREALLTVFSGTLEFNNLFASYKGEGTGAIRHMFAHHILKPERVPIEGNVWGTPRSSGSFSTLLKLRLQRALDYRAAPFEVSADRTDGRVVGGKVFGASPAFSGQLFTQWPPPAASAPRSVYLSCGSSHETRLTPGSVDLVITDPPFYDNVHYSELADFFYAWQQLNPAAFQATETTTRDPHEVQDVDSEDFARKLKAVFAECHRVLKDDGLLVFTYHHSRGEGWSSVADAVLGAGFSIVNAHPVKAELSVATPKSQSNEPIQLDVIMVCRKRTADTRSQLSADRAFARAQASAQRKALRLVGRIGPLSVKDRLVIHFSQYLVEACAGRSAEQLVDALSVKRTELELAALAAFGCVPNEASMSPFPAGANVPTGQLMLLEGGKSRRRHGSTEG